MINYKKTPCEKCYTECGSRGKRNTFFNEKNKCNNYTESEEAAKSKKLLEKIKEEFRKNPIRLF